MAFEGSCCVCRNWTFSPCIDSSYLDDSKYQIFQGKVIKTKKVKSYIFRGNRFKLSRWRSERYVTTIVVTRHYQTKFKEDKIRIVSDTKPHLDCGYIFSKNSSYLIVVGTEKSRVRFKKYYKTGICYPTKSLDRAKSDLSFIKRIFG